MAHQRVALKGLFERVFNIVKAISVIKSIAKIGYNILVGMGFAVIALLVYVLSEDKGFLAPYWLKKSLFGALLLFIFYLIGEGFKKVTRQ